MATIESMLAGKRILAIDDLVECRSAIKKMLQILGASHVDIAMDGDEATECILRTNYDIVFSDYNLGKGRDGQQILEEGRFTNRLPATATFVMLTGESAMEMVMGALENEPDDYITKPFNINVMRKRLLRILSIKEELKPINLAIDKQSKKLVLKACDAIMQKHPRLANRILRIKGRTLISQKQYEQALELYDQVLSDRELNWALLGKAACLIQQRKCADAKKLLEYTISLYPKYVQCYDHLASICLLEKDPVKAQEALEQAVQVSPKHILRQMELGRLAYENEDLVVAESAFRASMTLARSSCYRSANNYLMFAKSVQYKIRSRGGRGVRNRGQEALKAMEEVVTFYKDNPEYCFEATAIECTTFANLENMTEAQLKATEAAMYLDQIKQPTVSQLLVMANIYIDTQQHALAQNILSTIKSRQMLNNETEKLEFTKTVNRISETEVRAYTTEINDQAIEFFERGQLQQAIELFDQATSYKEAGIAVLLNAIQAKITYMDQKAVDSRIAAEVNEMFERVGDIHPDDERHRRWIQLKKNQERILRAL